MSLMQAFKFRQINKNLIDSLVNSYLYFSGPKKLNDPLDCQVDVIASIERAIEKSDGQCKENLKRLLISDEFLQSITKLVSEIGICSFSRQLLRPMMWSHYADEHKGLSLYYELPESLIAYENNKIIGVSPVTYHDNAVSDSLADKAIDFAGTETWRVLEAIVTPIFSSKGEDWAVEDEWRIIRSEPGQLNIDRSFLKQICFGMATPERDKELIINIVERCDYDIQLCEIQRENTDFTLKAVDL